MLAAMNRSRLLLVALSLAAILAGIWLLSLQYGQTSQAAYGRIKQGMLKDEVLAIMTDSPGNYATSFYTAVGRVEEGQSTAGKRLTWINNSGQITVEFDDRGEVCWKELLTLETEKSVPQQLRRVWWSAKQQFQKPAP
jgi:hypothetical protein